MKFISNCRGDAKNGNAKSAEETVKNPVLSEPKASSADLGFGAPIFRSEKSQRGVSLVRFFSLKKRNEQKKNKNKQPPSPLKGWQPAEKPTKSPLGDLGVKDNWKI